MSLTERLNSSGKTEIGGDFLLTVLKDSQAPRNTAAEICKKIAAHSGLVQRHSSFLELQRLTNELVKIYSLQGRLKEDPFEPTRGRKIHLPFAEINVELKDSVCVVTGGLGCVGSMLVNELLRFEVKAIIILDNSKRTLFNDSKRIINLHCDIRDSQSLSEIFSIYKPDIVFSAAAQRDPGFAESHVAETVDTNIFGTLNIVKACEASTSVRQMVFASTGKASRYFTEEVYAGTKKVGEFIMAAYARKSKVKYSLVRFTHILDNSLMNMEFRAKSITDQYLSIHGPGKYVTAQNAKEAAHLMLNAVIYSTHHRCNFLLVSHLEWPVESLEMAIFHIKQSGRGIPVIFSGNPAGYSEKFFRGQMDWSRPHQLNLLINVFEGEHRKVTSDGDIIVAQVCPTDEITLEQVLKKMEKAHGELEKKESLTEGLKQLVRESLKLVDQRNTIQILRWGLDPAVMDTENSGISNFGQVVPLLVESLANSKYYQEAKDLISELT